MDGSKAQGAELLMTAIGEICEMIAQIDLTEDTLLILQQRIEPEEVGREFHYTDYIRDHAAYIDDDAGLVVRSLDVEELLGEYQSGKTAIDLSFQRGTVKVSFVKSGGAPARAFLILLKSDETNILRQITNLYVFNHCDYFIYLDSQTDSYIMFSGSNTGTPLPPAYCKSYHTEIVKYARDFVVPEDQEMVIREMALDRVLEELDANGVHVIYAGVMDPTRGYTRKRLEYRYCDQGKRMVLLSRTDITDIFQEEQKHRRDLQLALEQAHSDPLTGVLNQQGMLMRAQRLLEDSNSLNALLFIDLDNFKAVNDTYGHLAGDALLKAVANCLLLEVRQNDFVGRYGGDEFVVFLNGIRSVKSVRKRANEICSHILESVCHEGDEVAVTCSIGAALFPREAATYQELIHLADQRLYIAKTSGKNQVVVEGGAGPDA